MRCQWQAYLQLLPAWMREEVDKHGKENLEELRLRVGLPPQLYLHDADLFMEREVSREDVNFVVNAASRYSPWAAASISNGYITASGGHRIGICGETVVQEGSMTGIRTVTSLCMRVARDFPGIASDLKKQKGSVLIIGPPGCGKTTLLRDLIRQRSTNGPGSIAVVDERGEVFPYVGGTPCYNIGTRTDVLTGCTKRQGIDALLRTMGPSCIAVDEITEESDCKALLKAGWCGVDLLATAHAHDKYDLMSRPIYKSLICNKLFDCLLILHRDKSWQVERM